MLRQAISALRPARLLARSCRSFGSNSGNEDNDTQIMKELELTGIHLDEIDKIMSDEVLKPLDNYYPKLDIDPMRVQKPFEGHNLVVIQPWAAYANFDEYTDPDIQLEECVSLGNTIHNWNVVGKKIVFVNHFNRKHIVGPKAFEDLKEVILSFKGVSAVLFGIEMLSGVQLATLEKELRMPVFDRFTVVLNIFRQHARTKEAKIQLALAELPYIKSHLREIHESSEFSSSAESLKLLVGGAGEKVYHQRLNILKRREQKLKFVMEQIRKQRDLSKKTRRKGDMPVVSIVGYTNSGKTTLTRYLTEDQKVIPQDQLFATLDVSSHIGQLPSSKNVVYMDTIGFLSRIPLLLIEAFSVTLKDIQESNLIIHVLDITHPDHRLQYATVEKALQSLKITKDLLERKLTLGNKCDLLKEDTPLDTLPPCDLHISLTKRVNLQQMVEKIDQQLQKSLNNQPCQIIVENGGSKYSWLRKNSTILDCQPDQNDGNYLVCNVIMTPKAIGRWTKKFGYKDVLTNTEAFKREEESF